LEDFRLPPFDEGSLRGNVKRILQLVRWLIGDPEPCDHRQRSPGEHLLLQRPEPVLDHLISLQGGRPGLELFDPSLQVAIDPIFFISAGTRGGD
jgi:hypothetical protein